MYVVLQTTGRFSKFRLIVRSTLARVEQFAKLVVLDSLLIAKGEGELAEEVALVVRAAVAAQQRNHSVPRANRGDGERVLPDKIVA